MLTTLNSLKDTMKQTAVIGAQIEETHLITTNSSFHTLRRF